MLESYLLGTAAVIGLTLGWVAVQTAWSKAFPEAAADADVLARRMGCHGCGCSVVCERKPGRVAAWSGVTEPRQQGRGPAPETPQAPDPSIGSGVP